MHFLLYFAAYKYWLFQLRPIKIKVWCSPFYAAISFKMLIAGFQISRSIALLLCYCVANEWMCIYIPHISHTVSRRFTILIEWDRTSACKGASGCRYQSIFDLTHPPSPCMKCTMKQQIDHHTGNYAPYSFRQVCGFFNVPCWPCNTEDAGDGAYGL